MDKFNMKNINIFGTLLATKRVEADEKHLEGNE